MLKRSAVVVGILAAVMAGIGIQQAMAQETSAPKAPAATAAPAASVTATAAVTPTVSAPAAPTPSGPPGGPGMLRDPEAMKQMAEKMRTAAMDRFKEQLGSTDDEWKILQPRLEKVMTLAIQSRLGGTSMGGMGFMMGMARRLGGADTGPSEIDTAGQNLQKLLADKDSKPEDIKAALSTLREARAKARAELETAQKELREVLTMRQEAQLVSMGLLD